MTTTAPQRSDYKVNRRNESLIFIDTHGKMSAAALDQMMAEIKATVGGEINQRILLEVTSSAPDGIEGVKAVARGLQALTGVNRFALAGVGGVKKLIGRMLIRTVGQLSYELALFETLEPALRWLEEG